MGMFDGKKGLITGVFNKQSIAWAIADLIMQEGGECGFTYMPDKADDARQKNLGRVQKLTDGNPNAKFLQPMDVTNDEQIAAVMERTKQELGQIDFLLHSIAYANPEDLKGRYRGDQPRWFQARHGDQCLQPHRLGKWG